MKTAKHIKLRARFDPDIRFDLKPVVEDRMAREKVKSQFDRLQGDLERTVLRESISPRLHGAVSLASNEAAALAWTTQVPLLVMPELFEEKLRSRLLWQQHQDWVQIRAEALAEAL
jgi:hypothetical protein